MKSECPPAFFTSISSKGCPSIRKSAEILSVQVAAPDTVPGRRSMRCPSRFMFVYEIGLIRRHCQRLRSPCRMTVRGRVLSHAMGVRNSKLARMRSAVRDPLRPVDPARHMGQLSRYDGRSFSHIGRRELGLSRRSHIITNASAGRQRPDIRHRPAAAESLLRTSQLFTREWAVRCRWPSSSQIQFAPIPGS